MAIDAIALYQRLQKSIYINQAFGGISSNKCLPITVTDVMPRLNVEPLPLPLPVPPVTLTDNQAKTSNQFRTKLGAIPNYPPNT